MRGRGGKRPWATRGFALWWAMALCVHLAWVPNLVVFIQLPRVPRTVEVVPVGVAAATPAPPRGTRQGEAPAPAATEPRPRPEAPGSAPGARATDEAAPWVEYEREVPLPREQSWASRAMRSAATPQPERPRIRGRSASPRDGAADPDPGIFDHAARGEPVTMDSFALARGSRGTAPASRPSSAAGAASKGRHLPVGEGPTGLATEASGPDDAEARALAGAEPVRASPAISRGPRSTEADVEAPLGGSELSRQASPRVALAPSVRESRVASSRYGADDQGASARRFGSARGAGAAARGPAVAGRGEAEAGDGRAREPLYDEYIRRVRAKIRSHWGPYPEELAYGLHQGLVVLQVRVRHDGRVEEVTVSRSSGFDAFDEEAVAAVRRSDPLGPPPPELLFQQGGDSIVLPLAMNYRNPMFE